MPVSVRSLGQIASGLDTFFKAAAYGNEAAAPFSSIVKTPLAIAVSGGVSLELVVYAGVWSHIDDPLIELKTD